MPYLLPILALLCNAFFWGVSWWPFRAMHGAGLHPLWATALMYGLVSAGLLALRPATLGQLLRHPGLWLLALCSGVTNVAFNWAVTVGDVVRVVLLFYLIYRPEGPLPRALGGVGRAGVTRVKMVIGGQDELP